MALLPVKIKSLILWLHRNKPQLVPITIGLLMLSVIPVVNNALKPADYQSVNNSTPQVIISTPKVAHKTTSSEVTTPPKPAPTTSQTTSTPPPSMPKPVESPQPTVVPSPSSSVSNLVPSSPVTSSSPQGSNTGSTGSSTGSSSNQATTTIPNYDSSNWSGYMTTTKKYTTISGSWVVPIPTPNGGRFSADATWIGIGGVTTGDLIQVGTTNTIHSNGQVSSAAFYEMLPASSINISSMTINPGDSITASVSETSPSHWEININDTTDAQAFSINVTYSSTNSSAEWIEEDPSLVSGSLIPLDNFGAAAFTNCLTTASGSSLSIFSSSPDSITLVGNNGQVEALPSALNGSGNGFSVNWQSS